ncbi:hypothetical protein [Chitinophaga qingshengii]|uniref:Helix-turn-helix domain-containing protein n=1 Tax=Chitinophaga qingshengii TaxID=1569794 RepID=A0ABR7TNU7_9BACT|nr:hypothetical protein [Chitinophaga qingshengii]MBC9932150.1 hypothetical protein [Chitinophaga qingshengii]
MENNIDNYYIRLCLNVVETKLNRGPSSEWNTYDFEKLSVDIQEVTGISLSVTTLKRLWGKLSYQHTPAMTTLNTIARFAGYDDWRAFRLQTERKENADPMVGHLPEKGMPGVGHLREKGISNVNHLPEENAANVGHLPKEEKKRKGYMWWAFLLLPLAAGIFLWGRQPAKKADPAAYQFSSNKMIREGVPNSVIFHYDATAAGNDTVFIAQTWDVSRKVAVPKDKHQYSAIYYVPGYFKAKLMIGEQIVKTHDLLIRSGGWVALCEEEAPVPVYFKKEAFTQDSILSVDVPLLQKYSLYDRPKPAMVRFVNVQDMGGLQNDHFIFETMVKNPKHDKSVACQNVQVLLLCKDDVIIVSLCPKGCVGDLELYGRGHGVSSRDADLSGFGCELDSWVPLRIEGKGNQLRFLVNGKVAYELDCPNAAEEIVGLQYRFYGPGAIKNTRFIQDDRVLKL